ncbi:amidohydrolase [Georhizobium profundi]|jgi:aminocarboxymuconate-semialdehyde decarboxylase|uniref:Amidohydrolase n=1 Tax=Georhizobium profundi TaxID=2341112 RepID=A0A3S9B958_9HYPH|nr:amidohydrolase family protein [Georhizobium profundi]AZN73331.1 amidohydrolase [Georhizobium profundi]
MSQTVDYHTHVVPDRLASAPASEPRWPSVELRDDGMADVMIAGRVFRKIDRRSWDMQVRCRDMDADGIDVQVLSPMPELLSYWFDKRDGAAFCEAMNTQIVAMAASRPERFRAFGMVPLQAPETAAAQVRELRSTGALGVEIGSHVNGVALGDRSLDPFYEACEREGMTIMVHALHPVGIERVGGTPDVAVSMFPVETSLAALSLVVSGVPERFPDLDILLCHGGGSIGMLMPRLEQARRMKLAHLSGLNAKPADLVRRFHVDSVVYDARTLRYLVKMMGVERVVLGSDYPFAVMQADPAGFVRDALGKSADGVLSGPRGLL